MKVLKWDDDLAVVLPEELVEQMGLSAGDELRIVEVVERTLVVEKVDKRAESLKRMEQRGWPSLEGDKFDRDEANER